MKFIVSIVVMMFASGAMAHDTGKGDYGRGQRGIDQGQRGDYGKDRGQRGSDDRRWFWGEDRGWEDLQKDRDITILWPAHQGVPINNLCYDGVNFRTLEPMRYCARTVVRERRACLDGEGSFCRILRKGEEPRSSERLEEDYECTDYSVRQSYILGRQYRTSECAIWNEPLNPDTEVPYCKEFRDVTKQAPLTWDVEYYNTREMLGEGSMLPKHKDYTIPRCQ